MIRCCVSKAAPVLSVVALGLMLAGCDKCNDWGAIFRSGTDMAPQSCKSDTPRQAHVPENACPALDAGWTPVFRKGHAPTHERIGAGLARRAAHAYEIFYSKSHFACETEPA